ncbi:MAG TPA: hypothetical protein P5056_04290 [Candidatus Paceibacterota bacterium]|nr:hypothetical protein [Candidatus Paceibacterota bacterium]
MENNHAQRNPLPVLAPLVVILLAMLFVVPVPPDNFPVVMVPAGQRAVAMFPRGAIGVYLPAVILLTLEGGELTPYKDYYVLSRKRGTDEVPIRKTIDIDSLPFEYNIFIFQEQ